MSNQFLDKYDTNKIILISKITILRFNFIIQSNTKSLKNYKNNLYTCNIINNKINNYIKFLLFYY